MSDLLALLRADWQGADSKRRHAASLFVTMLLKHDDARVLDWTERQLQENRPKMTAETYEFLGQQRPVTDEMRAGIVSYGAALEDYLERFLDGQGRA